MNLRKPKNHTVSDMYKAWCRETLAANKDYIGAYDPRMRVAGIQIIYKKTDPTPIKQEAVIGIVDGVNTTFHTKKPPFCQGGGKRSEVVVYKNGNLQKRGNQYGGRNYRRVGGKIIMHRPPAKGDIIEVDYSIEAYNIIMSYTKFRLIIDTFNKYAAEAVIQGERFSFGNGLGYIYAARIERCFIHPRCDMVATRRVRKLEPDHPAIFFTDADYCIIKWQKFFKVTNETVYTFKPAKHSMNADFHKAIASNPILKTLYKYIPYKYYLDKLNTQLQQTA